MGSWLSTVVMFCPVPSLAFWDAPVIPFEVLGKPIAEIERIRGETGVEYTLNVFLNLLPLIVARNHKASFWRSALEIEMALGVLREDENGEEFDSWIVTKSDIHIQPILNGVICLRNPFFDRAQVR